MSLARSLSNLSQREEQALINRVNNLAASSGDMVAATYDPAGVEEQLAGLTATQTLTNKTINTASNTITVVEADVSDLGAYLENVVEDTTPQLGGDLDANGKNVQITPTAGGSDLTASGVTASVTVDTNATGVGAALTLASDGNYDEADATDTTLPCKALALETSTGTKKILLSGYIRNDAWAWTVGGLIYLSETTGAMTQTAPTTSGSIVQILGYATHADRMYFNPQLITVENA